MLSFFSKISGIVDKVTNLLSIAEALVGLAKAVKNRLSQIFSGKPETYNAKENEDGSDTTNLPQ